jgi:antitoxin component YwqK of YwqJK toxin-antitoxin module
MKKLIYIIGIFLIPIIAFGQENNIINTNDLYSVDEIAYFKKDSTLVTGKVNRWYENGQLMKEGTCKDGKQDGVWKEWHENGQIESEGTFKDGEEDGLFSMWHENGQLKGTGNYKNGKKDGIWEEFNEKDELKAKITYRFGIKVKTENYD